MSSLFSMRFAGEPNVVAVRQTVRHLTRLLAFHYHDQIRVTTAVSELVRAAANGGGGDVAVELSAEEHESKPSLCIEVRGPGLRPGAPAECRRATAAAEKLLQHFDRVDARDAGPVLKLRRALPPLGPAVTPARARLIARELQRLHASCTRTYSDELSEQAHELSDTLLELERKQEELDTLNAELGDTNRGVMALYAELDERANHLRRADEVKTRFFSHMSHEFRTPLSSILALSRLLLEETDGALTAEQAKQVRLIRDSAAEMLDLVSDLLDLAKVEAGKSKVHVVQFSVATLFGALRGMMRPLLAASCVRLEFGTVAALPPVISDEGKVMQILRNFLSNAVKFTEQGTITVTARMLRAGDRPPSGDEPLPQDGVLFCVEDTGIGISKADQDVIFEEFSQVRHALQRKVRGTGLGLPLCRRLASLLDGSVWVESELGRGSRFYLLVPRVHREAASQPSLAADSLREPLLIVSDRADHRAALEDAFADSLFAPIAAHAAEVTAALMASVHPAVAVIDASLDDAPSCAASEAIRAAGVPLLLAGGGGATGEEPRAPAARHELVAAAYRALLRAELGAVLVIDDDQRFRTILSKSLEPLCRRVIATGDPFAALSTAGAGGIDCAVLDLMMPELDGMELLARLRRDRATEALPVLVCSSKALSAAERTELRRMRTAFVPKEGLGAEQLARGLLEARRHALPAEVRARAAAAEVLA